MKACSLQLISFVQVILVKTLWLGAHGMRKDPIYPNSSITALWRDKFQTSARPEIISHLGSVDIIQRVIPISSI